MSAVDPGCHLSNRYQDILHWTNGHSRLPSHDADTVAFEAPVLASADTGIVEKAGHAEGVVGAGLVTEALEASSGTADLEDE